MKITFCLFFVLLTRLSCTSSEGESCGLNIALNESITGTLSKDQNKPMVWTDFTSSANNDCTLPDRPTSLLLEGKHQGSNRLLTLCLPRPDLLAEGPLNLANEEEIVFIAMFADRGDCLLSKDNTKEFSGKIDFSGVCDNGTHAEGYNATLEAVVPVTLTCGEEVTEDSITLSGTVSVQEITP